MKKKGLRQEDCACPYLLALEHRKRLGVYFIFKTMELGPIFAPPCRSIPPKIRVIASSSALGLVTPTATSTSAMKYSVP